MEDQGHQLTPIIPINDEDCFGALPGHDRGQIISSYWRQRMSMENLPDLTRDEKNGLVSYIWPAMKLFYDRHREDTPDLIEHELPLNFLIVAALVVMNMYYLDRTFWDVWQDPDHDLVKSAANFHENRAVQRLLMEAKIQGGRSGYGFDSFPADHELSEATVFKEIASYSHIANSGFFQRRTKRMAKMSKEEIVIVKQEMAENRETAPLIAGSSSIAEVVYIASDDQDD